MGGAMAIDSLREFTDAEALALFADTNISRKIRGAHCFWERELLEAIRMVVGQIISNPMSSTCACCESGMNS